MTSWTHADTAIVQATSSVSSQSITLSNAVSIGDVICLVWASPAPDSDTVSDNSPGGSNTWTSPNAGAFFTKFAYTIATKASAGGITITTTGGGSGTRFMVADRFAPVGGTAVFGNSTAGTALTGTSGNLGSLSSVPAGELLWGGAHGDSTSLTFTAGSSNAVAATIGSQVGNTGGSGFSEYILSGAGGTESVTWTASGSGFSGNAGGWEAYFTITGTVGIGQVQPQATVPVPRRRLARAIVQHITGLPPPAKPNRQPPPGPRPRPPRRAVIQHVTGTIPVFGKAPREPFQPSRARRPQRAVVRSITGTAPAITAVYRPQLRQPVPRRPSRAVVLSVRPPPAAAAAGIPSGFQDRRPGYLKKRILFGI